MAKMYRQEFEVSGGFSFPVDMLRYDCCFPADETQSAIINRSFEGERGAPLTVRLARYTRNDFAPITPERWQSFGWKVTKQPWVERTV